MNIEVRAEKAGTYKRRVEVEGEKKPHRFPRTSDKVLCYTSQLKTRKKSRKNRLIDTRWLKNLPRCQGVRPDQVRVKTSSCCFARELESFVRPRDLASFSP